MLRTTPPPTMRFLALHAHRTLPGRAPAPLAAFQDDTDYYALRFEGVERLYGPGTLANLAGSHVCVVGLGGVGSWAVEALARSGVGSLTLMDPDEVCISNTNRQTNALRGTVGRSKAKVLAEQLGRKRGPPRFGHSSADQAAPAPERVPGADEARPAWANQPLGPYNNAGQPHIGLVFDLGGACGGDQPRLLRARARGVVHAGRGPRRARRRGVRRSGGTASCGRRRRAGWLCRARRN